MNIEFNIFKIKPDSDTYNKWSKQEYLKNDINSEFIVVGEEKDYLKLIPIENNQICLIGGLKLDEVSYLVDKEDVYYTSHTGEFDIPKSYLNLDIVDNIKRVNERLISR